MITTFNNKIFNIFILALGILIIYGYEIFNLNITIDEELHYNWQLHQSKQWISQARWGMFILNSILLPSTVVPAVSISIGLIGTAAALIIYFRNIYQNDNFSIYFFTILILSFSTFAFIFIFSTIAYGIGIGILALSYSIIFLEKINFFIYDKRLQILNILEKIIKLARSFLIN